jgi:hypothetical protein
VVGLGLASREHVRFGRAVQEAAVLAAVAALLLDTATAGAGSACLPALPALVGQVLLALLLLIFVVGHHVLLSATQMVQC